MMTEMDKLAMALRKQACSQLLDCAFQCMWGRNNNVSPDHFLQIKNHDFDQPMLQWDELKDSVKNRGGALPD